MVSKTKFNSDGELVIDPTHSLYKRVGVPEEYFKLGTAVDALSWKAYGSVVGNEEIRKGLLEPGAVLSKNRGDHITIFLGYRYDENNNIEGYFHWDQDGELEQYHFFEHDKYRGVNYEKK
jgi:hypothetical protein